MIWGSFSSKRMTDLCIVGLCLKFECYTDVLGKYLIPYYYQNHETNSGDFIVTHDRA